MSRDLNQIAQLVAAGFSDREIALRLDVSNHEIKESIGQLARRVGADSRPALLVGLMRHPVFAVLISEALECHGSLAFADQVRSSKSD